jgi:hypothetical protein
MSIFKNILNRTIDQDRLASLLAMPRNYLGEDIVAIIPSLTMTNEGPVLTRVIAITESFLCDVIISGQDKNAFDIIDKNLATNIRISTAETTVIVGDDITTVYKTAKVRVLHVGSLESEIEFVGEERDDWLAAVLKVIPASLCVQRR